VLLVPLSFQLEIEERFLGLRKPTRFAGSEREETTRLAPLGNDSFTLGEEEASPSLFFRKGVILWVYSR
jgi:hypothetical protein